MDLPRGQVWGLKFKGCIVVLAFCLLGTLQTYIGFIDLIHKDEVFNFQLIKNSTLYSFQRILNNETSSYFSYNSWVDVFVGYLFFSLPLLGLFLFLRKRKYTLLACAAVYGVLAFIQVNGSVFYDRVAAWSTYDTSSIYYYAIMQPGILFFVFSCAFLVSLIYFVRYSFKDS